MVGLKRGEIDDVNFFVEDLLSIDAVDGSIQPKILEIMGEFRIYIYIY